MSFINNRPIFSLRSLPCTAKHGGVSLLLLALLALEIPWAAAQPVPEQNPYQYAKFSPSMAIIVVVLVAALFFMGFFSIYIRNCAGAQNGNSMAARVFSRRAAAARGLDPEVIQTFPTLAYSLVKGLKIGKSALECAVCLNEFEDEETLRLIPKCDHVFHPECIDAWLASHTTCPVCRANLIPQPGESVHLPTELLTELDVEAQNGAVLDEPPNPDLEREKEQGPEEPVVINVKQTLNRNRTRRSSSGRTRGLPFPRSHSTGHSLVPPGENTERFTLRLPIEVRKQIMNRHLSRAPSMVLLPREGSSRRGYRTGWEGSSRGKSYRRLENGDRMLKSDRWVFSMTPPFLMRALSLKSTKVVASNDGEGTSARPEGSGSGSESVRPPV
jgi:E3 ubiquitin-protein ligase ATL6/9/15/31/42/55